MATQGHARNVVVLSGKRTGFGTFGGSLKDFTATDLGVMAASGNMWATGYPTARPRAAANPRAMHTRVQRARWRRW